MQIFKNNYLVVVKMWLKISLRYLQLVKSLSSCIAHHFFVMPHLQVTIKQ